MRGIQINLDGRDAHYVQVALDDMEYKLYQRSADSADDKARWEQVRDLNLRTGRAIVRQQMVDMGIVEGNR